MGEYFVYFPFFKPQSGSKRFAAQPQTIYSEFPKENFLKKKNSTLFERQNLPLGVCALFFGIIGRFFL